MGAAGVREKQDCCGTAAFWVRKKVDQTIRECTGNVTLPRRKGIAGSMGGGDTRAAMDTERSSLHSCLGGPDIF